MNSLKLTTVHLTPYTVEELSNVSTFICVLVNCTGKASVAYIIQYHKLLGKSNILDFMHPLFY